MLNFCITLSALILCRSSGIDGGLVWSDEFDGEAGTTPSSDNWRYDLGDGSHLGIPGWGNSELQYYTNHSENCATDGDGHLVITAKRSNSSYHCFYGQCSYTSTRMVSKFTQLYGRFEARIKTPSGKGVWPAFWMLGANIATVGWPVCGEIDIMELKGSRPNKVSGALHGPGYNGGESLHSSYALKSSSGETFSDDFHVFAVDWEPNRVTWLVDDEAYVSRTPADLPKDARWVFDTPFYMLINLAIGGNFDGYPHANETFPKKLVVDYVRVYNYTGPNCDIPAPKGTEATSSDGFINYGNLFNVIVSFIVSLL